MALWGIPGIGPFTLEEIGRSVGDDRWAELLSMPILDWLSELPVALTRPVRFHLARARTLDALAERTEVRARKAGMRICYRGAPPYPDSLAAVKEDMPPLLFYRGSPGPPRRRLAMVGSRHPDQDFLSFARNFAGKVAHGGVGVVSGAAQGIDQACHLGALDVGGETWAFVGSSLDCLDPAQAQLARPILDGHGVLFSELPPGVHASKTSFPRRNRLISAASDAVLVLRAGKGSGSLITAKAGLKQGRLVLAMPGDVRSEAARGCNQLLRDGTAKACVDLKDVWDALRVRDPQPASQPAAAPLGWDGLPDETRKAYEALSREPQPFEVILTKSGLPSAALTSALCELELLGRALQHPGKCYERV